MLDGHQCDIVFAVLGIHLNICSKQLQLFQCRLLNRSGVDVRTKCAKKYYFKINTALSRVLSCHDRIYPHMANSLACLVAALQQCVFSVTAVEVAKT